MIPTLSSPFYASPDGSSLGAGTVNDPIDFSTALFNLGAGDTLILLDGVYSMPGMVTFGMASTSGNETTIKADTNATPIIVGADGYPAKLHIPDHNIIDGIWFGGERTATNNDAKTITMGSGCTVQNCTLINYINGIQNGSDAFGNQYIDNNFIRCGCGLYSHPIYIASRNATLPEHGNHVEGCVFVGCDGYSIHLYHEPAYSDAEYCFVGDALYGIAHQGDADGPVSINDVIVWRVTNAPLYSNVVSGTCDGIMWYATSKPDVGAGNCVPDANRFVGGVQTYGTNPITMTLAEAEIMLGETGANIDAAIDNLQTLCATDADGIYAARADISANLAVLRTVLAAWKQP